MKLNTIAGFLSFILICGCTSTKEPAQIPPVSLSGIYPQLAYYNNEGECGTGAVVPWANRLWVITYGPHLPNGSSDKLYEITPDLQQIIRDESIGGTPANRMIHKESNQLFIGPYAINQSGDVRTIPYTVMPGRHTGNARHLTDPANKIYYGTMEEGFYEVDVHSLAVTELYNDVNKSPRKDSNTGIESPNASLPGVHGKGLYSGQGLMYYTNNGEGSQEAMSKFDVQAGVLAEWNGKDWSTARRNQFVEVTGPGGIYGNENPETDPVWATGWDYKSVLLGVREPGKGWTFYRLPKASHTYDGAHGWNTEWPRIRDIGTEGNPDYLMTMHGMFWRFPSTFTSESSAGIRPRSAYLKVIGDFARWNDQLVFGCDDSAQKEFLNKRKAKGNIEGPGQSNSNLWFTTFSTPDELGPATANGSVWAKEMVSAGTYSEPFLFAGWDNRSCWIHNAGHQTVSYTLEIDEQGIGQWKKLTEITVPAGKSHTHAFHSSEKAEWIRVKTDKPTTTTVSFNYSTADKRNLQPDDIFTGLSPVTASESLEGLLYGLGDNRRALGMVARTITNGQSKETGYYELNDKLELLRKEDEQTVNFIREKFAIPTQVVTIDEGSILVVDDSNRRWRLPLGNDSYTSLTNQANLRICREVATERDLFNCHGTFYELPAENADGYAKIRPVASHNYRIHDYASYRGLLVMSGITSDETQNNEHIILSDDCKAALWAGTIDDLWKMGKPVGKGGPWVKANVKAGEKSDPYLIGFYDSKELTLSHQENKPVTFKLEADPTGNGDFMEYATYVVKSGEEFSTKLPESFQARWVRFSVDTDAQVTTWLEYK